MIVKQIKVLGRRMDEQNEKILNKELENIKNKAEMNNNWNEKYTRMNPQ